MKVFIVKTKAKYDGVVREGKWLARGERQAKNARKNPSTTSVTELKEGSYYSCDCCQASVRYPHKCGGLGYGDEWYLGYPEEG